MICIRSTFGRGQQYKLTTGHFTKCVVDLACSVDIFWRHRNLDAGKKLQKRGCKLLRIHGFPYEMNIGM